MLTCPGFSCEEWIFELYCVFLLQDIIGLSKATEDIHNNIFTMETNI